LAKLKFKLKLLQLLAIVILGILNIRCQNNPNLWPQISTTRFQLTPWDEQNQIVNGDEVTQQDSFSSSIVGVRNLENGSLCTGTLITRTHVLTAAHCLGHRAGSLRIFTGLSIWATTAILDAVTAVTTTDWQTRSKEFYNRGDLAIIKITGGLPKTYRPINLGSANSLQNGNEVLIAGYGRTNGVRKVGLGSLRKTDARISDINFSETEIQFDQRHIQGACHGDSGGPAFIRTPSGFAQWGVTSREDQDPEKDCTHYTIYTKIDPYMNWIKQNILD
jgi:secreted trypsin-like serine protease